MNISEHLFDLTGKNAVVVGGAGGIGQAIAQGLAVYGARVAIASRREESLKRAQQEILESSGKQVCYYTVDAGDEDSVIALLNAALAEFGEVDILVNAQGFNQKFPATEFPMDVWDQMFSVNVRSLMLTCKHFGAHMKQNGSGKIINLSSVRGVRACGGGNTGYGAHQGRGGYDDTYAGQGAWARGLRQRHRPHDHLYPHDGRRPSRRPAGAGSQGGQYAAQAHRRTGRLRRTRRISGLCRL